MSYFEKIEKLPQPDLSWNIPERKQGKVNVVGGNSQQFKTEIRISEYLGEKYPFERVVTILPDALKTKLPALENLIFLKSVSAGSFAGAKELVEVINSVDYSLLIGDLSKNAVTGKAVVEACGDAVRPVLISRDAVDVVADNMTDRVLMNENLIVMASMAQLIKLLRAVYYPRMLLVSQSLVQVAEIIHKFTLSYPISIIVLHNGQVIIARNGEVKTVALEKTGCSPIGFWHGEKAGDIMAYNLYNPNQFLDATVTALMK